MLDGDSRRVSHGGGPPAQKLLGYSAVAPAAELGSRRLGSGSPSAGASAAGRLGEREPQRAGASADARTGGRRGRAIGLRAISAGAAAAGHQRQARRRHRQRRGAGACSGRWKRGPRSDGRRSSGRAQHHAAHPDVLGGVRQQRDVACPLQRDGQRPLVARAGAGLASRLDLAALREVAAQPRDVLVVDVADLVDAEGTDLPTRRILPGVLTSAATTCAAAALLLPPGFLAGTDCSP